ncbi:MAG: hypothetical protein KKE44_24595 [Proteobacteria bacterium]|nr:hypothetical protein [Pseudomonadota bacterium]MBU1585912.1 hypothetical protein [Pseudomonadota bacterium]MBU2627105.1 hypothetical protein [Pseudomonadota bacterium]
MKSGKKILYAVLGLFFLISACRDDNKKNDYSGVSDLISERNKARYEVAENPPKKRTTNKTNTSAPEVTSENEALSSIVLYEEDVEIVASKSQRILAKGVAYVNKKGQIVRIKIIKE